MTANVWTPPDQRPSPRNRDWLHILLAGAGLFVVATIVMFLTENPNLYPTVILIGNFLVPVVFVLFLYDHQHLSALTPTTIAQSFVVGGMLGVLGASVLEPLLIPLPPNSNQSLTLSTAVVVGLIEEGCKILAVMWVARRIRRDSEMDGLLLGAAAGMGFAALESTGYAFTAFVASRGQVGVSIVETILPGMLAPFGHGVWTAILAAMLFSRSAPHHFRITGSVVLTYLFVALLHGLWDGLPRVLYVVVPPGIPISVVTLTLSAIGIVVLVVLYRQAERRQMMPPASLEP
jgi:RsiW-degrading membrane proteinase PrsW (M82 family)